MELATATVKVCIPEWIKARLQIGDENNIDLVVPALRPACTLNPGNTLVHDAFSSEFAAKTKRGQTAQPQPE